MPEAPGGCAIGKRGAWVSRAVTARKMVIFSQGNPCVCGVMLHQVPHSACICHFHFCYLSTWAMSTSSPEELQMWLWVCLKSACELLRRRIQFAVSLRSSTAVSGASFSSSSESCSSEALHMVVSFSRMLAVQCNSMFSLKHWPPRSVVCCVIVISFNLWRLFLLHLKIFFPFIF